MNRVIRTARKLLRKLGIYSVCVDTVKNCENPTNDLEFKDLVQMIVDDTIYYEGKW